MRLSFLQKGMDDDEDDEDEDEDEDDEDVQTARSQQKAAQFGWFDDIFVFDPGRFI
jgi:hypothetical protein